MELERNKPRNTSYAFSLVELLIVVAILGILAAIALPTFQSHTTQAKEAAAKDNLRILRNVIELYAAQHNDIPPGYPGNDPSLQPSNMALRHQLFTSGNYLPKSPTNPLNGRNTINMVFNNVPFPGQGQVNELYGWVYQPQTKTIKLNWYGTDTNGQPFLSGLLK